jgi:hypothetical protein
MGVTRLPLRTSVGTQYAAVSAFRPHVVAARRSSPIVASARIALLPKNVWSCERPGCPGYTIGSSGPKRLTVQWARKLTTRDVLS